MVAAIAGEHRALRCRTGRTRHNSVMGRGFALRHLALRPAACIAIFSSGTPQTDRSQRCRP